VEVIVRNDLPATGSGSGGHAVGLTSARQRVVALTDGRGRIDAGVEDGRFVARLWLPVRPAASPQSA